jgi:Methyladenine glycosylase
MRAAWRHRCTWAKSDPLRRASHDEEWGVPERDSRALWDKRQMDGIQKARERGVHLGRKKRLTSQQSAELRRQRAQGMLIKRV